MKRFVLAAVLLGSAAHARAAAPVTGTYTYTAVDEVSSSGSYLTVKGVLSGDPTPTTLVFPMPYTSNQPYSSVYSEPLADTCQRLALLTMTRPGQYVLKIVFAGSWVQSCGLARATP